MQSSFFFPLPAYRLKYFMPHYFAKARRLQEIIADCEYEVGIRLTPQAKEMIMIPVLEQLEAGSAINWDDVRSSVLSLVVVIIEEPVRGEKIKGKWSALAMIRAFWRRFCNIPPFCRRVERGQGEEEIGQGSDL